MGNDPTETNNLAAIQPEKVKELETLFNKWESDLSSDW